MTWLKYPELVESARAYYNGEEPKHVLMVREPGWGSFNFHPLTDEMENIGYTTGAALMGMLYT